MAQRTGAERFLASPAKTASAGLCLALAAAALLLCGCGGGSSEPAEAGTQATDASAGTAADSPDSQGSSSAASGSGETPAARAAEEAASGGAGIPGAAPPGGGAGAKHGPRIAAPKGPREPEPTPAEKANATVADMTLQSPALRNQQEGVLTYTYTCDGRDLSPALNWSGVPAGAKELILYVMNGQPVDGRLFFDWAVAGLDPATSGIEIGKLPPGAVEGTNSFGQRGYSICPAHGSAETYIFALFALPKALSPQKGFDPRPLREEILAVSRDVGLLTVAYARQ